MNRIRLTFAMFLLPLFLPVQGQGTDWDWYSETRHDGVLIQNSFPKGGPYTGPTYRHFNHSYLVFFSRIVNETSEPLALKLGFNSDSFPIPNSPHTYVKLFLPPQTMTFEKRVLFSYGITSLASLEQATHFQKKLNPHEECFIYVVALFYQTKPEAWRQERGGNRGEFVLQGQDLYYNLRPQVDMRPCGQLMVDP